VGSTPYALVGLGGMRLWGAPWRHALRLHVLRRRLLHQSCLLCVGHPLGGIRTQIPAVTRLTKGHSAGVCFRPPGWLTRRKQDQRLGPRCRTAEVGPRRHLIRQRLHGGARRVGTQRQAATPKFEVKRPGTWGHSNDCMAVPLSGYSASKFAGAAGSSSKRCSVASYGGGRV